MPRVTLRQAGETAVEMKGGEGEGAWTVRVDVPGAEGGAATGAKPTELLAMSVAACKAIAAMKYAERKQSPLDGVIVEVDYEMADNPRRIARMNILFKGIKAQVNGDMLERIVAAMNGCAIASTLKNPVEIATRVE